LRFDLPTPDEATEPYWAATRDGELLFKRCADCGRPHFYPRPFCPFCWSESVSWEKASGRGTVYTFSVVHVNDLPPFPARVPYVAAIVDLDEGPRVMTNIVDCAHDAVRIGMPVAAVFEAETDRITLARFRPAS
jgi:uncharacterized protein